MKRLLNIVGENKGWAIPNRAKNLAPYLKEYFDITDYFKWDLPDNFNDYDLIHMHHPVLNEKILGINTVWGFEASSERLLPKILNSGICEKANFIIAKNKNIHKILYPKYRTCHLMSNGVDTKLFKPNPIRVGWVGNDSSSKEYEIYKGTDLIGQACEKLNTDLQGLFNIVFVKDPSQYPAIFPQEKVVEFYKTLDVFVLASEAEGSSNVVLEALAMGIPVVTTKVGNWEHLARFGAVILVERTVEAIKEGIQIAIQEKITQRRMVEQSYNWANHAKQYLKIYKQVGIVL